MAAILLRPGSDGKSKPFEKDHAERLLAYPGTKWERADEPTKETGKSKAAAAKNAPAAPSPEGDATGQPTSV